MIGREMLTRSAFSRVYGEGDIENSNRDLKEGGKGEDDRVRWSLVFLLIALSIPPIVLGFGYISECPIASGIPLCLGLVGALTLFTQVLDIYALSQNSKGAVNPHCAEVLSLTCTVTKFAVFVTDVVLIGVTFEKKEYEDKTSKNYCNKYIYWTNFVYTVVWMFTVFVYVLVVTFCLLWAYRLNKKRAQSSVDTTLSPSPTDSVKYETPEPTTSRSVRREEEEIVEN